MSQKINVTQTVTTCPDLGQQEEETHEMFHGHQMI